jgi:hypothetical protein
MLGARCSSPAYRHTGNVAGRSLRPPSRQRSSSAASSSRTCRTGVTCSNHFAYCWLLFIFNTSTHLATETSAMTVSMTLSEPIRIDTGLIRGAPSQYNEAVTTFKGIPFAASTGGDHRWKAPQPASPWGSVRDCSEYGPIPPQLPPGPLYLTEESVPQSEDCLNLNVWTPAGVSDRSSRTDLASLLTHVACRHREGEVPSLRVDLRRKVLVGSRFRPQLRWHLACEPRHRLYHLQLPIRYTRLARSPRAEQGVWAQSLRQLWST